MILNFYYHFYNIYWRKNSNNFKYLSKRIIQNHFHQKSFRITIKKNVSTRKKNEHKTVGKGLESNKNHRPKNVNRKTVIWIEGIELNKNKQSNPFSLPVWYIYGQQGKRGNRLWTINEKKYRKYRLNDLKKCWLNYLLMRAPSGQHLYRKISRKWRCSCYIVNLQSCCTVYDFLSA